MTRPTPKEIKAIADVAGVPVSADVADAHRQFHRSGV